MGLMPAVPLDVTMWTGLLSTCVLDLLLGLVVKLALCLVPCVLRFSWDYGVSLSAGGGHLLGLMLKAQSWLAGAVLRGGVYIRCVVRLKPTLVSCCL